MRRLTAVVGAVAVLGVPAAARAAGAPPAFSPGRWSGTMRIEGGIDTGNLHASGQGTGDFAFTITRAGFVTSGNLSVSESIVTTGPQGTFHSSTSGALPLNGDARNVSGAGTMTFHIDTPFGPVDGPVDAEISLIPLRTTCTRASGDAAIPERQFQAAEGIGTNVTAEFTARRSAGLSGADVAQVARGAARDVQLYLDHPTNSPLAELAGRAVKSLSATVASASACGGRPAGFEHGVLANRDVGPKIRQLFDLAAANHGALDPLNLEVVVEAAVEAGASRPQLQTLVAAVEDLIGQPPLNGEAESLRAILLSASRYNLTDLAAAAQAALDALGP